jgi:serine phosphatase RsbU (regulator of sigma subunit)
VAARNRGAHEVGGDFYDVIPLEAQSAERRAQSAGDGTTFIGDGVSALSTRHSALGTQLLGLVIADVCGKGVPAALFVALTRSLLRAASQWAPPAAPGEIVERALALVNDYIAIEHAPSNMFITLVYAVLDPATGELAYVNAGHNPPLLARATGEVVPLPPTVLPIGIMETQRYAAQHAQLRPGDLLLCFTDGVTEALDADQQEFGDARLLASLRKAAAAGAHATIDAVERAVDAFAAGAPQADDITLLAVSREASGER